MISATNSDTASAPHPASAPHSSTASRAWRILPAALAIGCLTACGASVETDSRPEVSVHNCGVTKIYPRPTAPVAYDVSTIEKMFALGLAEKMRGIVLPTTVSSVIEKSPYREEYGKVPTIGDGLLAQEPMVQAKADWVFAGWKAGFSPERGITPESLEKVGINSYMQEETCYNYGENPPPPTSPIEATYTDLTTLGAIFGVSDRATALVKDLRAKEGQLREAAAAKAKRPRVLVYDSGVSEPYTVGNRAAADQIIELAGGTSVTHEVPGRWTAVGWESVVDAQPEVIVIVDYNKQPASEKIDFLRSQSPIKHSPAVREGRITVMDYGAMVSSPRNLDAASGLAGYFTANGFA